jgi:hypothetical protein
VPAAAVIPAPIAYIKVVAVKKLVVEFRIRRFGLYLRDSTEAAGSYLLETAVLLTGCSRTLGLLL